jgi:CHASE3 domain sensor protein
MNMTIGKKMAAGFGLVIAALLTISAVNYSKIEKLNGRRQLPFPIDDNPGRKRGD